MSSINEISPIQTITPLTETPETEETVNTKQILLKFVLVGDRATGKTCIMNQFGENIFNKDIYHETMNPSCCIKEISIDDTDNDKKYIIQLQLWDTSGIHPPSSSFFDENTERIPTTTTTIPSLSSLKSEKHPKSTNKHNKTLSNDTNKNMKQHNYLNYNNDDHDDDDDRVNEPLLQSQPKRDRDDQVIQTLLDLIDDDEEEEDDIICPRPSQKPQKPQNNNDRGYSSSSSSTTATS
eukprot:37859_1